jgi:outer membrane protein
MLKQIAIASLIASVSSVALAGPWTVKAGASVLAPTGSGTLLEATNEVNFTPSIEYRFGSTPFSAELLLALPFDQEVEYVATGSEAATLKHLPPTLTAKYNFPSYKGFSPYVGAGITVFIPWDEDLTGSSAKLEASTEVGAAGQIGFIFKPADAKNWGVYFDVRYADLSTEVKVNGAKLEDVELNPLVYTLGFSYNF